MCAWHPAKVEAMDRSELTKYDRYVDGLRHWIEDEKQNEQNGGVAPPRPLMRGDGAYPPEYPEHDPPRGDLPNRVKQAARSNAAPDPGRASTGGPGGVPEPKGPPPAKGCPRKAPPRAPPPFKAAPSQGTTAGPSSSSRAKTPPPPPPWREDQNQGGRRTPPPSQNKGVRTHHRPGPSKAQTEEGRKAEVARQAQDGAATGGQGLREGAREPRAKPSPSRKRQPWT